MNYDPNLISKVKEILEAHFPDRWDVREGEGYGLKILVHFPEFYITNSLDQSHKIRDLYLKLEFGRPPGVTLRTYSASRTTLTQAEKQSRYGHSHISKSITEGKWGGFCLGEGPINSQVQSLIRYGISDRDFNTFEMFLIGMESYLQWESIEGGPYIYIADIKRRMKIETVPVEHLEDTLKKYINVCNYKGFSIVDKKRIVIDHNDDDFLKSLLPVVRNEHKVNRDAEGRYYNEGKNIEYPDLSLNETFKGELLIQKVITDESEQEEIEREEFPHPDVAFYVAKQLSRKLSLHAYKKRRVVEREPVGDNIGGFMVQDL